MKKAIIVSRKEFTADMISATLKNMGYSNISTFVSGSEARRYILNMPADIIIINSPVNDESGAELAVYAAEKTAAFVIFLCSRDIAENLADKLSSFNILVLSKPVSSATISDGIKLLDADTAHFSDIRESDEVMQRICDIRLINRAKSMLMKYLNFTEPQAHRRLEKMAMNNRCTRRNAAKKIISELT